ncbi:MAG: hypothetical protein GF316_04735 [Candidatus Lokiarchaeota archaeon]|nr:hypothetical protein [Candidatus Lokiarchaeota archaeon]
MIIYIIIRAIEIRLFLSVFLFAKYIKILPTIVLYFTFCFLAGYLVAGNGDFNLSGYSLSGGKPKKKKTP